MKTSVAIVFAEGDRSVGELLWTRLLSRGFKVDLLPTVSCLQESALGKGPDALDAVDVALIVWSYGAEYSDLIFESCAQASAQQKLLILRCDHAPLPSHVSAFVVELRGQTLDSVATDSIVVAIDAILSDRPEQPREHPSSRR